MCVEGGGGCVYVCGEWSGALLRQRAETLFWPVNSSRAPRQQTTGEGGQMRGRTVERLRGGLTTAASRFIITLL